MSRRSASFAAGHSRPRGDWGSPPVGRASGVAAALAVAGLTSAAFLPALHGGFVWDDEAYIKANEGFHGLGWRQIRWMFTTFHAGHYMPLTWLSWSVDYLVWGTDLFGYHLGNLILHMANVLVFLLIAHRLLSLTAPSAAPGARYAAAVLAALIFGVHPLRVESVAWATERKDCLSGLFYLLTILLYLRTVGLNPGRRRKIGFVLALIAYALALLAKVMSVSLPLVLVALDVYPLRRLGTGTCGWVGPVTRRVWTEKLPFFLLAAAAAAAAPFAASHAQALGSLAKYGPADRLAISVFSLAFYVRKVLWPVDLSALYEMPPEVNELAPKYMLSAILVAVVTGGLVLCRRRWPAGLTAWWCYVVCLLPVMGLVQVGPQITADRYTYLSCLGWSLLMAGGLLRVWQHSGSRLLRPLLYLLCLAAVACLWGLTWRQCGFWRNHQALWSHAIAVDNDCSICHYNLGTVLIDASRPEEAITHFREAIRVGPQAAKAHYNWGKVLSDLGQTEEAMEHYRAAMAVDPKYAAPRFNLADLLHKRGEPEEAIALYARVCELEPDDARAFNALGNLLSSTGRFREAVERFNQGLRVDPYSAETRNNLGIALGKLGRRQEAVAQFQTALRIKRDYAEAYNNLANALAASGQLEEAVVNYREAIARQPTAAAYNNLANAQSRLNRLEEAEVNYRQALRLDPDFAQAHNNLANLLVRVRQFDQAVSHYESAIRLDAGFAEAYHNLGAVLVQRRQYGRAIDVFEKGLSRWPQEVTLANYLALLLAAAPVPGQRNGERAVHMAESAAQATGLENAQILSTLAAAYAEVGRFDEARRTAERALALAEAQNQNPLAEQIRARLALYQSGLPYRLPAEAK